MVFTEFNSTSLEGRVKSTQLVPVGTMNYMVLIKGCGFLRCGGSFISVQFILSVAHCFVTSAQEYRTVRKILLRQYQVSFGNVYRNNMKHTISIIDIEIPADNGNIQLFPSDNIAVLLVSTILVHEK